MSLLLNKLAIKDMQMKEVKNMRVIAWAYQNWNLANFEKVLKDYKDSVCFKLFLFLSLAVVSYRPLLVPNDLTTLYVTLLEQDVPWIVELNSVVDIEFVAQQVGQGQQAVKAKYVITSLCYWTFRQAYPGP